MHHCFPFRSALAAHITLTLRNEGLFSVPREDRAADAAGGSCSGAVIDLLFRRYLLPMAFLSNGRTQRIFIASSRKNLLNVTWVGTRVNRVPHQAAIFI